MDRDQILRQFDFHHWATDRVLDAFAAVSAEQLDKPWGGSFGSGRALLKHVVGVERLWLDRWLGSSPKTLPDFPATLSGAGFRDEWRKTKAEQQRFLDEITSAQLASDLTYVNMKGVKATYVFGEILRHNVNHGTYHRGQMVHLLRDLGLSAPSTDYLLFVEERRKDQD
jgi:uncharacterized damage-inducible protein DinB